MKKIARIAITIMVVFAFPLYVFTSKVTAATLTNGSLSMTDSRPSNASTSYTISFQGVTATTIKCIKIKFSDAVTAGSKPTGMTITAAALATSTMVTQSNWAAGLTANNTTGVIDITYATGQSGTNGNLEISGITNGSTKEVPYYVQFSTFNNIDCVSSPVDTGLTAFIYTDGVTVTATVDPSISFVVTGIPDATGVNGATTNVTSTATTVPFGIVTTSTNKIGGNILTISTNAGNGFTVFTRNTQLMTSGGFTIAAHADPNSAPTTFPTANTTEAFGYTTTDATLGTGTAGRFISNKWAGFATTFTGNEVFYNGGPITSTAVSVGMQIAINGTTEAGTYTTVVEYSAVPIY